MELKGSGSRMPGPGLRTWLLLLGAWCLCAASTSSLAVVIYDNTISKGATAIPASNVLTNCRADQGCLGNAGLVDSNNDGAVNGSDTDTLVQQSFSFVLSAAERAALLAAGSGSGTLSVTASRDIGHRVGASDTEAILILGIEGSGLGNLFQTTIDNCPAGERGSPGYADNLECGPNFHTDVTATDSQAITLALLQTAAGDSTIQFTLDPSAGMGRLKLFSAQLVIDAVAPGGTVSEPATLALIAFGLIGVAYARRRKLN